MVTNLGNLSRVAELVGLKVDVIVYVDDPGNFSGQARDEDNSNSSGLVAIPLKRDLLPAWRGRAETSLGLPS